MNGFQMIALLVVAGLFIATVAALFRGSASRRDGFLWALLWLTAGVALAWPEVTAIVARALGIGRGADLVLYSAVVVMMIGFLMVYARLRRLQREVTLLVRHLAMREATIAADALGGDSPTAPAEPRRAGNNRAAEGEMAAGGPEVSSE